MNRTLTGAMAAAAMLTATARRTAADERFGGAPVLDSLPTTTPEFQRRARDLPSLGTIASEGVGIYGGHTQLLLGGDLPVGPAPHTPWARPLPGGPLRVTFIYTVHRSSDLAEIVRRLDCEPRYIQVLDQYHGAKSYPEAMKGYLKRQALETLAEDSDVILVSPNVRLFDDEVHGVLLDKVAAGTGCVVIGGARYGGGRQYAWWLERDNLPLWQAFSRHLTARVELKHLGYETIYDHRVDSPSGLFAGIPWRLLPTTYLFAAEPAPEVEVLAANNGFPMALGGHWGQGRALLLTWPPMQGAFPGCEENAVPRLNQYQEYYSQAMIRALLWAAGRPQPVTFSVAERSVPAGTDLTLAFDGEAEDGRIAVRTAGLPADARLFWRRRYLVHDADFWRDMSMPTAPFSVPAGDWILDLIARDAHGHSLGFASFAMTAEAPGALDVTLDRDRYLPGQPVTIAGHVSGSISGELAARVEVYDALHRHLMDEVVPVVGGRFQAVFPNRQPLCPLHYAQVTIEEDERVWLRGRRDIFVPQYGPEDFTCWLWPGSRPSYQQDRVFRNQREQLGFQVIMGGGYGGTHRARNYGLLTSGCDIFYSNIAPSAPLDHEKAPVDTRESVLKMVDDQTEELRLHGGLAFFFQDERHGRGDSGEPTPQALAMFREWLRERYADIAELNHAWGRDFADFDEVEPTLTADFDPARETHIAPWLEWRLWVLDWIIQTDRMGAQRIRAAIGEPCNLGLEGIFGLSGHNIPYGGTDLAEQARDCFNIAGPYGEQILNACRSFYPGFLFSWGGYNQPYNRYRRYIWSCVLQGHGGMGFWYGPVYYNDFDCWYPQARWIRDLSRLPREGVGRLIRANAPSLVDPIAFLYSQSSLYSMAVLGRSVDPDNAHMLVRPAAWARISLQRMLQDAGVQFGFVSERQFQEREGAGLKMLVLSSALALAPETCAAIERFVANGGVVFADLCPGVYDHRGSYRQPGQLDALFGVSREEPFSFATMVSEWGVGGFEALPEFNIKGQWFIGQYYESTLKLADGQALGKHIFGPAKPPAFVFNRSGKGATVLANYLETEYRRVPDNWQVVLARELLRLADIQPPLDMRDRNAGGAFIETERQILRFRDGAADYVGVLLDTGRDVDFDLKRDGHVYALCRGGGYLGEGPHVTLDMRDEPHAVLAVLPYRVEGLAASSSGGRRGEALPLALQLQVSTGQPVKHVAHLDVYEPDGTKNGPLSLNVLLENGRWDGSLPLALSDPAGDWRIVAREVCSGQQAELRVPVR